MGDHAELHDVVVVDVSDDLAGAYCAKLFTDAGAVVTRVEPPGGDPMRRWQWSGEPTEGDAALFRYLRHGQRSVVAEAGDPALTDLCAAADVVITGAHGPAGDPGGLAERCPGTVVVAL